jgi:hypothetical protein
VKQNIFDLKTLVGRAKCWHYTSLTNSMFFGRLFTVSILDLETRMNSASVEREQAHVICLGTKYIDFWLLKYLRMYKYLRIQLFDYNAEQLHCPVKGTALLSPVLRAHWRCAPCYTLAPILSFTYGMGWSTYGYPSQERSFPYFSEKRNST